MRSSFLAAVAATSIAVAFPLVARAQGVVRYDLDLESADFPDLAADPRIDGEPGEEFLFEARLVIDSRDIAKEEGIQGWSLALWNAGVELVSVTTEGTESEEIEARARRKDAFFVYQVIDPDRPENGGREGVVQAAVLSLEEPIVLAPNRPHVVGRNLYRARIGESGRFAFLRYEDDLRGSGQPVQNQTSVLGQTVTPGLAEREIEIGRGAVAEAGHCADGADNDGDGWADCADPSCRADAACGAEVCDDGADNDADGLVDCADPDCGAIASCQEVCDNGVDDDDDGRVDCDDFDCARFAACSRQELCLGGVDEDEDGLTDCDDLECRGRPACRVPEDCDNGTTT